MTNFMKTTTRKLIPFILTVCSSMSAGTVTFDNDRNYFIDSEDAGRVRVGAAWGTPGLYSEDNKNLVLGVPNTKSVYLGTNGNFMTVKGDGNVGVGTTSPNTSLHVQRTGTSELRLDLAPSPWNFTKINTEGAYSRFVGAYRTEIVTDANENVTYHRGIRIGSNASMSDYATASSEASCFSIALDINATPQYLFSVIGSTGNIGVGTTTPDHKLDVNGTIRGKEVIVETGWSDFVFEDSYKLRPLDEVESHIEKFGHLPDVPSAAVVESEGLSVGEAQKIMMQKIEELTLYVIEQDKKIAAQQKEIDRLKAN